MVKKKVKKIVKKISRKTIRKKRMVKSAIRSAKAVDFQKIKVKPKFKVSSRAGPISRKINLILGNFLLFILLLVLSIVLYSASGTDFYQSLFFLLGLIFGVISLAFLIALLALVFLRILKK